jgi:hypothetical protein
VCVCVCSSPVDFLFFMLLIILITLTSGRCNEFHAISYITWNRICKMFISDQYVNFITKDELMI